MKVHFIDLRILQIEEFKDGIAIIRKGTLHHKKKTHFL